MTNTLREKTNREKEKKYRVCEICGKKALFLFSPDLDIQGLGACKKHKEDMQLAYIILLSKDGGEKEYNDFIKQLKSNLK
jgi:hypothetical protein